MTASVDHLYIGKVLKVIFLFSSITLSQGILSEETENSVLPPEDAFECLEDAFQCLMEPVAEVTLKSPVAGIVRKIQVDRGNRFKRVQTLMTLQATAELAAIELAKATLELGQRQETVVQELFRENFPSEHSVDEAVTEAKLVQVEPKQAQTILRQKTLKNPVNGLMVEGLVQTGEFISDHEISKLAQLNPLYLEVVLPVEKIGTVKRGTKAMIYPQQPIGGQYEAEIKTVDHVLDAASGTFGVRLELPNPKNSLPAGLRCRVSFLVS